MTRRWLTLVSAASVFSLAGCKKPCEAYARHLARFAAPGRQESVRFGALQACTNGRVTAEQIDCVLQSSDEREAYRCHVGAGPTTPPAPPRAPVSAPAPIPLRRVIFIGFSRSPNSARQKDDLRRVLQATWLPRWRACLARGTGPEGRLPPTPLPMGLLDFAVKLSIAADGRVRAIGWSTGDQTSTMVEGKEPGAAEKACFEQTTSDRWEGQATGDSEVKLIFRLQR